MRAPWFAFVHPYRDQLERGLVQEVMAAHVLPALPLFLSRAVEPVLVELLTASSLGAVVPFAPARAGRCWSPAAELDVVLLDAPSRRAFVAEVKWGDRPAGLDLLDDLRARASRVPELSALDKTFAVISRAGFRGRRRLAEDERAVDARALALV